MESYDTIYAFQGYNCIPGSVAISLARGPTTPQCSFGVVYELKSVWTPLKSGTIVVRIAENAFTKQKPDVIYIEHK